MMMEGAISELPMLPLLYFFVRELLLRVITVTVAVSLGTNLHHTQLKLEQDRDSLLCLHAVRAFCHNLFFFSVIVLSSRISMRRRLRLLLEVQASCLSIFFF